MARKYGIYEGLFSGYRGCVLVEITRESATNYFWVWINDNGNPVSGNERRASKKHFLFLSDELSDCLIWFRKIKTEADLAQAAQAALMSLVVECKKASGA